MEENRTIAGKKVAKHELIPGISKAKAFFLLAAMLSFLLSVYLYFSGDHDRGLYVGIWVPSILSAGALLLSKEDRGE
jgi:hypothetical protein